MALKTGDQYLTSIESLKLTSNILGEKTNDLSEHGMVGPSRKAVAFTFDAAHHPETNEMFCVESSCFLRQGISPVRRPSPSPGT